MSASRRVSQRPAASAPGSRPSSRETAARPTPTRAACRSSPAPSPNRGFRSRALPVERITLDLLVEIRPGHVERAGGLADVPVVLTQLGEQERALGRLLELLERLAVEQ